ncbi:hypothetical protein B0H10DRAFT_1942068 [Mycena sp. CBHHK59/15]|nr:hypothetical protein B0H10DRAFT_1942068 [Mycena sp. CBHHK59/15]
MEQHKNVPSLDCNQAQNHNSQPKSYCQIIFSDKKCHTLLKNEFTQTLQADIALDSVSASTPARSASASTSAAMPANTATQASSLCLATTEPLGSIISSIGCAPQPSLDPLFVPTVALKHRVDSDSEPQPDAKKPQLVGGGVLMWCSSRIQSAN